MVSRDYEELFKSLNVHKVKSLVVGAHAVVFYTEPRFTKDLDIWIPPDLNTPEAVYRALKQFGAPLRGVSIQDFADKSMILQIGIDPIRVDILIDVEGVSSKSAWKNRVKTRYGKTPIAVMGIEDLIRSKRRAGRPQDRLDLKHLTHRHRKRRNKPKSS